MNYLDIDAESLLYVGVASGLGLGSIGAVYTVGDKVIDNIPPRISASVIKAVVIGAFSTISAFYSVYCGNLVFGAFHSLLKDGTKHFGDWRMTALSLAALSTATGVTALIARKTMSVAIDYFRDENGPELEAYPLARSIVCLSQEV